MDANKPFHQVAAERAKELVKSAGFPLHMESQYCHDHRKEHQSCRNCESVEGCKRLTKLLQLLLMFAMMPPVDEDDFHMKTELFERTTREILSR